MSDDEDGNFGGGGGDAGDLQLPKATVFRAIKDALPDGLRCSSETGNLVMECCMELLKMVCDEAMQISTGDGKSTIGDSHVQRAVESLGFKPEWRECLQRALAEYKESQKNRPKMSKNPVLASGLSMEELIRQQKEMLAEAKARRAALAAKGAGKSGAGGAGTAPASHAGDAMQATERGGASESTADGGGREKANGMSEGEGPKECVKEGKEGSAQTAGTKRKAVGADEGGVGGSPEAKSKGRPKKR